LLETGVLCNHAKLSAEGEGTGDPLELALLHAARDQGIDVEELRDGWRQTAERPFDSALKMMLTAHRSDGEARLFCKGAPERLIELACSNLTADGDTVAMTADMRGEWSRRADEMAASGLRVLALARSVDGDGKGSVEDVGDLVLLGLVGFQDPPRHDVEEAIQACQDAGIRVVMVTGDHIATATAISRQVGIETQTATGIDGASLDQILCSEDGGQFELRKANVFARVTPEHKLRLVEQLQAAGEIVAMTGDGVNDAPALRKADIGVAMGKRGTDVAREAADMVLLDDSFPTIVAAIAQGRVIFENIRRFVVYLLSCNLSEVLVVALAILFGLPMALLPLQILFLNLVTDVFPAFALAAGKGDPDILKRPPRPPSEQLIGTPEWSVIVRYGLTITAVTVIALVVAVRGLGLDAAEATTVSFLTIAVAQLLHVFNMRKPGSSFLVNDVTRNRWVWAALGLCGLLLALAVYVPWAAAALQLTPPSLSAWLLIIGLGMMPVIVARLVEAFELKNSRAIVANT
jgi:Ca2+-transporting ATPase